MTQFSMHGPSSIADLRPLAGLAHLEPPLAANITTPNVGLPLSLARKTLTSATSIAFGLQKLGHLTVVCDECGGRSLTGECHGEIGEASKISISRPRRLDGLNLRESAEESFASITDEMHYLTYAQIRNDFDSSGPERRYSVLDYGTPLLADVRCNVCDSAFSPRDYGLAWREIVQHPQWDAIGPSSHMEYLAIAACESISGNEDDDLNIDASILGEESDPDDSSRSPQEAEPPPDDTLSPDEFSLGCCPVCLQTSLHVEVYGTTVKYSGGRASASLKFSSTTWDRTFDALTHVCIAEIASDQGDWVSRPSMQNGGYLQCSNGCFQARAQDLNAIPSALLALAAAQAARHQGAALHRLHKIYDAVITEWQVQGEPAISGSSFVSEAIQKLRFLSFMPSEFDEDSEDISANPPWKDIAKLRLRALRHLQELL